MTVFNFAAGVAGVLPGSLAGALTPTSTDKVMVVQSSNVANSTGAALMTIDSIGAYSDASTQLVPTSAAQNPTILDHTNNRKVLVVTADLTITPPVVIANLGSSTGDGHQMTLLNPDGHVVTFGTSSGGFSFVGLGGVTSTAIAGAYQFKTTSATGTTRFVASIPVAAVPAGPSIIFSSISSTTPSGTSTVVYNFANGGPATGAAFTATLGGTAITFLSGPTVVTSSGSGSTAIGTVTFTMTNPAASTVAMVATTTGTYATTSASRNITFVSVANALAITVQPSTANDGDVGLVFSGTWAGNSAPTGFTYAWSASGGSGTAASPTISGTGGSGTWSISIPAPVSVTGSLTLTVTGTGPNTASAVSAAVTVSGVQPYSIDGAGTLTTTVSGIHFSITNFHTSMTNSAAYTDMVATITRTSGTRVLSVGGYVNIGLTDSNPNTGAYTTSGQTFNVGANAFSGTLAMGSFNSGDLRYSAGPFYLMAFEVGAVASTALVIPYPIAKV